MGNRVYLEVVNETPRGSDLSQEIIKLYDDYDSCEVSNYEGKAPEDDKELFLFTLPLLSREGIEIIEFAEENEKGIHVNDQYYEFEEWFPWYSEFESSQKKE